MPAEFEIIPAAEGLKRVRFFSKAPDGRIFVTDMFDLTDNEKGKVYILDDFDEKTGKFGKVSEYLCGLKNPNSVAFYTDEKGQDWFYLGGNRQTYAAQIHKKRTKTDRHKTANSGDIS